MNLQQRSSPFISMKCNARCHSAASDMWASNNKALPFEIICEESYLTVLSIQMNSDIEIIL